MSELFSCSRYYQLRPSRAVRTSVARKLLAAAKDEGLTVIGPPQTVNFAGEQETREGVRLLWAYDLMGREIGGMVHHWQLRADVQVELMADDWDGPSELN